MCDYYVKMFCVGSIGLGWAHDAFNDAYHMLMHFHAYVPSFIYILFIDLFGAFLRVSLSLPLSFLC